jgi:Bacterial protein of unknown function (DUF899)
LITTRSASSGVPRSILAQREGHARGGESSALSGMPNWSKLSFQYDPIRGMSDSAYARGVDSLWGMYQWLDRAPKGRNETGVWWRRHDEYDTR